MKLGTKLNFIQITFQLRGSAMGPEVDYIIYFNFFGIFSGRQ
jgi:hypothetical protein